MKQVKETVVDHEYARRINGTLTILKLSHQKIRRYPGMNAREDLRHLKLNEWADYCHGESVERGWWTAGDQFDPIVMASKIALIHSEVSEMLEGLRKGLTDVHLPHRSAEEVEAADIFIRLMDYCGARNLNILDATIEKMEYNLTRADHQTIARAAEGGKQF